MWQIYIYIKVTILFECIYIDVYCILLKRFKAGWVWLRSEFCVYLVTHCKEWTCEEKRDTYIKLGGSNQVGLVPIEEWNIWVCRFWLGGWMVKFICQCNMHSNENDLSFWMLWVWNVNGMDLFRCPNIIILFIFLSLLKFHQFYWLLVYYM